jgi:hypothetical protein
MEWKESLSDEQKASVEKFNSVEDLVKSYLNIEATSSNSLRIPGPDSTAEQKAQSYQKVMKHMPELMLKPNMEDDIQAEEYYRMIGVPVDADGYDAGDTQLDDATIGELKQLAVNTKMTKVQFKNYISDMDKMNNFTQTQREESLTLQGAQLKDVWGLATPDRLKVVESHLAENNLGVLANYSPEQIQGHYNVAISLVGKAQAHSQPTPTNGLVPDEAKAQLVEVSAQLFDKQLDLQHTNPVKYKNLMDKRITLMEAANPARYS